MQTGLGQLLMVSAVVMGLSQTFTKERIFEPLRRVCGPRERLLGYLVSCPYCASHYFAFALVPLTGTYPLQVAIPEGWLAAVLRWFLSSILVTVIAAVMRVAFWFVDEGQSLLRKQKQLVEKEADELPPPPMSRPSDREEERVHRGV